MAKSAYPADWETISRRVRESAGNRCEWCGVPNGALGWRDPRSGYFTDHHHHPLWNASDREVLVGGETRMTRRDGSTYTARLIRVVLTVAHLGAYRGSVTPGQPIPWGTPHDKSDIRPDNLVALCNRCHLGYDRDDHAKHAAATRRRSRVESGQLPLL